MSARRPYSILIIGVPYFTNVYFHVKLLISAHIYMESKSSTHNGALFWKVDLPIVLEECPDFEFEKFSSPKYNKFAVECDWSCKI